MSPFDIKHASVDELNAHFGTHNWVIARRTKNIVAKYGDNVVCVTQAAYTRAEQAIYKKRGWARPAEKVMRELLHFACAADIDFKHSATAIIARDMLEQARN